MNMDHMMKMMSLSTQFQAQYAAEAEQAKQFADAGEAARAALLQAKEAMTKMRDIALQHGQTVREQYRNSVDIIAVLDEVKAYSPETAAPDLREACENTLSECDEKVAFADACRAEVDERIAACEIMAQDYGEWSQEAMRKHNRMLKKEE